MRLFVNGTGASAGGGLTYLRNVLPDLAEQEDLQCVVALNAGTKDKLPTFPEISFCEPARSKNAFIRFAEEQIVLPRMLRQSRSDVLLSIGNFALRNCPVPQILLSRNALYTSADFYQDVRQRNEFRLLADSRIKASLAKRSILEADLTIAPTDAFARELQLWTGKPVFALHHGFDPNEFFRDQSALPAYIEARLAEHGDAVRLLHVSHYNYYRNFETLFRALALLKARLDGKPVKLFLTCRLSPGQNPGAYKTGRAAQLIRHLGIEEDLIQLGHIPYSQLHQLYRACDIYVSAAYAESFAHPLVEAMACGLPLAISDIAVHREISTGSALYFGRFAPEELAAAVHGITNSPSLAKSLSQQGLRRARDFSWKQHVERILELATSAAQSHRDELVRAA
jgi:glycosyltransferase involved in cell wall biosynthesis